MKKARIILGIIALSLVINGILAFNTSRWGLSNLYLTTTGTFSGGSGVITTLRYATLSPYRTFATDINQVTIAVTRTLYTSVTLTTTTINGLAVTYTAATGFAWNGAVYDDEDQ